MPPAHFDDSASRLWDAVVVGAGPAGALAARELARRGRSALLVDRARFPRYKVCGCCLNLRALSALDVVGLGNLVQGLGGVPVEALLLGGRGRRAHIPLPGGAVLSREALDDGLVEAACKAGVTFMAETTASLDACEADARTVLLRQADAEVAVRARIVLAADGLGGRLLKTEGVETVPVEGSRIGAGVIAETAPEFYRPGIIHMACSSGGYVGLVRLEDGRLNIAAAFQLNYLKSSGGMGTAAAGVLREAGFPSIESFEELPWRGTPALTRQASRVSGPRLFALGDAAGYIEPFTGEGMAWALTSGAAVASIADRAIAAHDPRLEREWECVYKGLVRRRQWACRLLATGLRWRGLVPLGAAAAPIIPLIARPFVRRVNFPAKKKGPVLP